MDNLSHSRLQNRGSTSVSKKICNGTNGGGPFVAQTIYDDVYGGPPKFGVSALSPRFEDYGEIFGSFHALRASSIPILDLPAVDEAEVFFDARSSAFDYSEVFGGFDGLDFAISYEELVGASQGVDDGSSDEAWTPAGTESLSDCSDHSGNSHCMSNGDSNQSFGGSTEFCLSYNKVNREGNGDVSNGKIHVTQLEMLPGFSYLVDEANPSPKGTDDDPSLQTNDDSYLNIDFDTGKVKGKHPRIAMPAPVDSNGSGPLLDDNRISQNGHDRGVCRSHEDFITVSEISLRTEPSQVPPPSRPPPKFATTKGDYSKMTLTYMEDASRKNSDDHSLPLFDVEVDASSSAAASAAAMKDAMEKAQAQLQNAKDLWERKKEGVHGRMRLDVKNDMKEKEGNLTKIPNRFKSLADERVQGISEIHDHELSFPAREERQKDVKATEVFSMPYGEEEHLTAAKKTVLIRSGSRFLVSENSDYCSEWKDATEFFELARADISGKEFQSVNNDEISNFVTGQVGAETIIEAWENDKDQDKKGKPFHTAHVQNEEVKSLENMVQEKEQDKIKLKPNRNEPRQKERVKLKIHQGVCDLEANDRRSGLAQELIEEKKQMSDASELEKHEKPIEFRQLNCVLKVEQPVSLKDIEQEKKKVVKRKENGNILKESHRKDNHANKMEEAIENENSEKLLAEACEREKLEQKMRMFLEQQENKKRLNLVLEDENFKGQKAGERQLEGVQGMEDHGKKEKEAAKVGVCESSELAHERENDKKWPKDFQYREECEKGVEDSFQRLNIEIMPRDAGKCKVTQMLVKDPQDSADLKGTSMEHDELERLKDKRNSTIGSQAYVEVKDLGISAVTVHMNDDKNHLPTGVACSTGMPEEFSIVDVSGERETSVMVNETSLGSGGFENLQLHKNSCASSAFQAEVDHHKVPVEMEDADIQLSFDELTIKAGKETSFLPKPGHTQAEGTNSEDAVSSENSTSMDEEESEIEENVLKMEDIKTSPPLYGSDEKAVQADVGMEEFVGRKKYVTRMDADPEHIENNLFCCMEDKVKSSGQVEDKGQKVSVQGFNIRVETGNGLESTRPTFSERTQKSGEFAHEVSVNQAAGRKEKIVNQSHISKGKESERVKSDAEFENDILQKLEEEREREKEREKDRMHIDRIALEEEREREREREREKDRMPIDRIALEPRDRIGAEARERAEKAALERMTAEARQRALAEARERLEKACEEARENSLAGKATMEARVKAERAAVERATAEARERAAGKAMSDRTSFGVRERMERSVSDKFSTSSKINEMRQKSSTSGQPILQSQSFGSSISSRHAYYSAYDERNEGVDGESPQRCKARLERHQRTAERAAKALAEKNMRDILAQREQAERNRLAETLDADVRRWSSGKQGNLRALLSTLQYILGPESGWQPLPLTEVITAAAVKKAYRKATLCVHPDKLQQRGASIHQKYICEKVFDLLKEAWNKFNSEER